MRRGIWIAQAIFILAQGSLWPGRVSQEIPENCEEGVQDSGALYLICMPVTKPWNGDLLIYAHGYVAFNEPLDFQDLELPDGTFLPDLVNGLGYAFATSSYSRNGLAALEGVDDVRDLADIFEGIYGKPGQSYLAGGSEGGLITTLAIEQYPDIFDGGLAACGPIGSFQDQIDYWGDFRVVFDVYFPDVIPGSPVDIPAEVIDNWDALYAPAIEQAIEADPAATAQLLSVTGAPVAISDPDTELETVLGLLWYNVFATNDGIDRLGGQPFGNMLTLYRGSSNNIYLNRKVERFVSEQAALDEISANYETSGILSSPLVTLHTLRDPIVPFDHEPQYLAKVVESDSQAQYAHIPIPRYGHCEFNKIEVLVAFAVLVRKTTGQELAGVEALLADADEWAAYIELARDHGAMP